MILLQIDSAIQAMQFRAYAHSTKCTYSSQFLPIVNIIMVQGHDAVKLAGIDVSLFTSSE